MFTEKKLYKSTNKMLDGVCAGLAEFIGIDPTIIRVIYAIVSVCTGGVVGLILYIVLAFAMPRRPFPEYDYNNDQNNQNK